LLNPGRTEIAEPVGEQLMRIWNLKSLYLILSTSSNLWFFQISGNCKTQVYHFFHHARPVHVTQVLQATDHRVLVVRDHDHCPFLARLLELEKRPVMIRDRFRKDSRKKNTSCETAKHENVPNVTTFLPKLVDSN